MDDHSYAMPPSYAQPMAPWYPMEAYSVDTARGLEDRSLSRDLASCPPTQLEPSHTMDIYPSLPIGTARVLEHAPFPRDLPSFPPTNGVPMGDPPDIERVDSDSQSEAEAVESDPGSESEPEDHPLPADAARWISMSPTQFDREYPGGNPFVFEELNFGSEEDAQSASYVELGASALNRIFIIFYAVKVAIFPFWITDIQREIIWGIVADLLKDGKTWLWVDGDEEQCCDLPWDRYPNPSLTSSLAYVKRKLPCSPLWLRTPRIPTWSNFRERVSKVSFAMRVSAISWTTFTSVSVREAGWEMGRADWTRSALSETASQWYNPLLGSLGVRGLLVDESQHSHLEAAFKALRCHGHSCYSYLEYSEDSEPLRRLLYLQSFLRSTLSGKDLSIILFVELSRGYCQQCAKLKELCISSTTSINNAPRFPPLSLLLLNYLRLHLDIDTAAWLSILVLSLSHGMISAAILTKVDDEIRRMHLYNDNRFDCRYQPWVNRLPRSLRYSVLAFSESEWREAEHAVRRATQHESVPTSPWDSLDIGLGVWITASCLLMSEHSSQKLTPRKYWNACGGNWINSFHRPVYPTHIAASVEAFCDATSESSGISTHTCCEFSWDEYELVLRQCYAAAYLLLHPESQHVPLLDPLRRPVSCKLCSFRKNKCLNCERCRKLPEAEFLVPSQPMVSDAMIPPEDMDSDSESELEDYPLPADAAHWILMSPSPGAQSVCKPLYHNLMSLLLMKVSPVNNTTRTTNSVMETLNECAELLRSFDAVTSLVRSHIYRDRLLQVASVLGLSDDPRIRQALQADETDIAEILHHLSLSDADREAVIALEGDEAQSFLNVVQDVLDQGFYFRDPAKAAQARRLLVKLSVNCYKLPSELFIEGVTRTEEHATFGGGFSDVFRGTYQDAVVAVKRIRIFQTDTDLPKKRRKFCQEALTWQSLRHAYIVPFLGIVGEEFPTALCMVSPWMRHGTVLKHLADNGRASVNKRLYEISQGLEYLHSQHVVHGDLRGCNILINDSWQACLTDFGLTVFHDATPATSTSRHEGSVRWMAPELHMPSKFAMARFRRTPASDIYAFGCVCLELYTGRAPFHDIVHETQIILEVIEGQRPDRPTYTDPILSDELWRLIQACWSEKSSDRPSTSDVVSILKDLSHPLLQALPMLKVPIPSPSVVEFDGDVPQFMGLTTEDEALPGISFRPMDKARARPREEESEDDIGNRPTKKVKGKGKAPAEGEKKFRLSEVQTVIREDSRREV